MNTLAIALGFLAFLFLILFALSISGIIGPKSVGSS